MATPKPGLCCNLAGYPDTPPCDKAARHMCSRCRGAQYCSEKCQRAHYTVHRPYCLASVSAASAHPRGIPPRGIERLIRLSAETYERALVALRAGEQFKLLGRDCVATHALLRPDGEVWEAPSGLRVVPAPAASAEPPSGTQRYLTNWDRLMTECGSPVYARGNAEIAAFYDARTRDLVVLHKPTDRVVHTVDGVSGLDGVTLTVEADGSVTVSGTQTEG